MANCTRTRRVRPCTPLELVTWEREQDKQTRYIAAEDTARERAEQAETVLRCYDFARADEYCFLTADGLVVQAGMTLTRKAVPTESVTVVCKLDDDGSPFWYVVNMNRAPFEAGAYIKAVQLRQERNRAQGASK